MVGYVVLTVVFQPGVIAGCRVVLRDIPCTRIRERIDVATDVHAGQSMRLEGSGVGIPGHIQICRHVRQLARQVAVLVKGEVQLPAHAQVCLLAVQAGQRIVVVDRDNRLGEWQRCCVSIDLQIIGLSQEPFELRSVSSWTLVWIGLDWIGLDWRLLSCGQ